jgi:RimJ/RimL family protein N-acetyltransferase
MKTERLPGPAYRIITQRLVVRCYNPGDATLLKASVDENIEHLLPWMPWAEQEPEELEAKVQRLRRFRANFDMDTNYIYGVFDPAETRLLGGTGLHPRVGDKGLEIGYWIHKDFINQGLATEIAAALTRVAFEIHQVERVEIHCDPENARSAAVPRKLGFTHEATLRRRTQPARATIGDSMIWTLFVEDYPNTPCITAQLQAFDAIGRQIL